MGNDDKNYSKKIAQIISEETENLVKEEEHIFRNNEKENLLELKKSNLKVKYNPYSEDDARSMVKNRIGSRIKAEKELGFKYSYELKEGLQKLIDWRIATGTDRKL